VCSVCVHRCCYYIIHTTLRAPASQACHAIYSCICGTLCCWAIELRTNCASILGKEEIFAMVLCVSMHDQQNVATTGNRSKIRGLRTCMACRSLNIYMCTTLCWLFAQKLLRPTYQKFSGVLGLSGDSVAFSYWKTTSHDSWAIVLHCMRCSL
jgi:hypothetical protein